MCGLVPKNIFESGQVMHYPATMQARFEFETRSQTRNRYNRRHASVARRRRIRNTRSTRTSLDFIQFIRSRAASVFWHFKGNTSNSISFVPAYESNCIGCRTVCLFIKTCLGGASACIHPSSFRGRVALSSPISLISCALPRVMAYNARFHATNKRARSRKSFKETRSECSSCR